MSIEKIDLNKLGELITEYKNGRRWSGRYDPRQAGEEIGSKVNELVEAVNEIKRLTNKKTI